MKSALFSAAVLAFVLRCYGATVPYFESFETYEVGNTPVANFTEVSTAGWTISPPAFSGKAYQNSISATSPAIGIAAGENSSALVNFPGLGAGSFVLSTSFQIDSFSVGGGDINNTGRIGLAARGSDGSLASSGGDRYQVDYILDDDGLGHPTGRLWLREQNLFFGDSLNELSGASLPVSVGNIYTLTLTGAASGGSLALTAVLTDMSSLASISVSDTDTAFLLGGTYFGYLNGVKAEDGGSAALKAYFDNFAVGTAVETPDSALGMPFSALVFMLLAASHRVVVRRSNGA